MKGPECIHERTKTITGERIHQKTVPNTNVEIRNYSEVIQKIRQIRRLLNIGLAGYASILVKWGASTIFRPPL